MGEGAVLGREEAVILATWLLKKSMKDGNIVNGTDERITGM